MATLTQAELRNRILEHLGVKAAGQSASAEDSGLVDEALESSHSILRKFGLCPFALTAIPDWAQPGLRDYVAADVSPAFGKAVDVIATKAVAERELSRQLARHKSELRTMPDYY